MNKLMALTMLAVTTMLTAADWPQFRGINGVGSSAETNLPAGFDAKTGPKWKAALPGRGVSAPVIVGDMVYVTASSGVRDDRLHVLAFSAKTGEQLWHRQFAATGSTSAHPDTSMAAPTPVADASGVYALFATGDLAAFTPDGTLRWYRSLVDDYPNITNQVGMASSPILAKSGLIVPMDNAGDSFLALIDLATGKNLWKTARPKEANWTTPILRDLPDGKQEVLFCGSNLTAYDTSMGSKKWTAKYGGSIPSPSLAGDMLLLPGGGVTIGKLEAEGVAELWKSPRISTGMTSPVAFQGKVYGVTGAGVLYCADGKTGKIDWDFRVKGKFSASPVAADGKLYLFAEDGRLVTVKLGAEPEVIAESDTKERGQATPSIAGGAIFLRSERTLWCIGK